MSKVLHNGWRQRNMPVRNPRINVVLEKPLFHTIKLLAERDGVSLSLAASL
ncbi:MAG: hypothetical protein HZC10_05745 [Nitrospirae bacterium]|nr:hypothetical protein [Nitrospirota bacterium]